MRYLNTFSRFLVNLPYMVRLSIVTASLVVAMSLFLTLFPASHNGGILTIPVALAAWLFKQRGMLICIAVISLLMLIFLSLHWHEIIWPKSSLISFIIGGLVLLIEGYIILSLRNLLDLSDNAKIKAQQAEQQQMQLNQIKDQFLLNVNHELRTPLTEVYGYLELLLQHNSELEADMRARFLVNAMHGCEELQLLINNVLDTMQVGHDGYTVMLQECSVAQVVQEVIGHFNPLTLQDHSIHVAIPESLVIQANPQYMRQVLRNLLSNAFKYAPEQSPVLVSAETKPDSGEICINVKDVGPGIPPEEIPLLFGRFVRLKRDLSGPVRGTGLGLYVSRQLIEAMGGQIWVESTGIQGEGSRFCFTLPRVPSTPRLTAPSTYTSDAKGQEAGVDVSQVAQAGS